MSRRKQKFPSHITGEGDGANCQEEHEKISSAEDERHTDELLVEVNASPLIVVPNRNDTRNMEDLPIEPQQLNCRASNERYENKFNKGTDTSYASSNSCNEPTNNLIFHHLEGNTLIKVVESNSTLTSCRTFSQKQCHGAITSQETYVQSFIDKKDGDSPLLVANSCAGAILGPISYCSVPSAINSANNILSAKKVVFSLLDTTTQNDETLCQNTNEVISSAPSDKCHVLTKPDKCHNLASSDSCHNLATACERCPNLISPKRGDSLLPHDRCQDQASTESSNGMATPEKSYSLTLPRICHQLITTPDRCPGVSSLERCLDLRSPDGFHNSESCLNLSMPEKCSTSNVEKDNSIFCEVSSSSSEENVSSQVLDDRKSYSRNSEINFRCPVCDESFKSKRSFNSHILIHCQLVKSPTLGNKRAGDESVGGSADKKRQGANENSFSDMNDSNCTPLDLSYKKQEEKHLESVKMTELQNSSKYDSVPPTLNDTPRSKGDNNSSVLSDRSPLEDENENLVNEAREHEKAFFDHAQNELFLTEDSTMLEPPPPLPLFNSGGIIRRVRVGSDDGPPMVYRVKIYAEQIFASRILGMNEETGDKIELYKCFMCSLSFPSVSRLQAHLTHHKQRFICCKCNYSCDSRVQFSHHVQKKHLVKEFFRSEIQRVHGDSSEDSSNAENTVTVAALLSALHGSSLDRKSFQCKDEERRALSMVNEDQRYLVDSVPASPSPESQSEMGKNSETSSPGGDLFKMFSCRFCGKKFDRAFSCNRHERVHTGFKPCFCRICGRGFSEPRNLRHHVIRFHSDGSLRHLIKRDRRKRKEDESNTPSVSPTPSKELLRESCNMDPAGVFIADTLVNGSPSHGHQSNCLRSQGYYENGMYIKTDNHNEYASNLSEMLSASLDNSHRPKKTEKLSFPNSHDSDSQSLRVNFSDTALLHLCDDSMDRLEPGEIRLNLRTKIIDDGERGRRLVVADDQSEDGFDHSPQFSAYAPRLDIVQEPVRRDKALTPITDDIGRTFYECPYCYKFFGSTSDLNRHLDFHEDLRPYDCKYCEYSARTNSQLKVHKMRHEGIKQFGCDVCNYNGVTQSDLNRHKKTQSHIARNQNVCLVCGLGFYSSSQKKVHIVKCHPEMEGASSLIQMSLGFPATSHDSSTSNENRPSLVCQTLVNGPSQGLSSIHTSLSSPQKNTLVAPQHSSTHNESNLSVPLCESQQNFTSYTLSGQSKPSSLLTASSSPSVMVSLNI